MLEKKNGFDTISCKWNYKFRRGSLMMRKIMSLVVMILPALVVFSASEMTSERMFVHVRPELSSFWRTATNNVVELPIDMPATARSATLRVEGVGYEQIYSDLTGDICRLELPAATSPDKENVYKLTLKFDDGTERTAVVGVIEGMRTAAEGCSTRCRLSDSGLTWRKTSSRAVIPVPYGMTSLNVAKSGEVCAEMALDGAQGWCALRSVDVGSQYNLELASLDARVAANVLVCNPGTIVVVR